MPDGNVLVVGGSVVDGLSGYGAGFVNNGNSPTYQYYSPTNGSVTLHFSACRTSQVLKLPAQLKVLRAQASIWRRSPKDRRFLQGCIQWQARQGVVVRICV